MPLGDLPFREAMDIRYHIISDIASGFHDHFVQGIQEFIPLNCEG
jgi:hypothetical protein